MKRDSDGTHYTKLKLDDSFDKSACIQLVGTRKRAYLWIGTDTCFGTTARLKTLRNAIDRHLNFKRERSDAR